MAFKQEFFTLNNGNKIPAIAVIGTGTRWFKTEETDATFSQQLVDELKVALTLPGIVHIDAAEIYRTYPEVAAALRESNRPRDEIFITDKYSTQLKLSDDPIAGLNISLKTLGLDYVDLYLLHSPFIKNGSTLEECWKQMEKLYKSGKAKNIGVSNFRVEDLEKILKIATIKPQINQIEFNAALQNQSPGIVKFCKENNIQLEAYTPLGPFQRVQDTPEAKPFYDYIAELSKKYNKTEAQILLRWVTKRGILPVTTSSKPQRLHDAQNLFSFDLESSEVDKITELGLKLKATRLYWNDQYDKYNVDSQKI